jgi:hypothetical protein
MASRVDGLRITLTGRFVDRHDAAFLREIARLLEAQRARFPEDGAARTPAHGDPLRPRIARTESRS